MSIAAPIVAADLNATSSVSQQLFPTVEESRPRRKPYKARMATKVKWALGDVMERTISAQLTMSEILEWLEEEQELESDDVQRLARLGRVATKFFSLALDVSVMERISSRAVTEARPDAVRLEGSELTDG